MSPDVIPSPLRPYTGPGDNDPLTEDELTLLLAIPRAAESNPDGTLFRLPLGPDPSMGWIDATCAETRSIVVRLADAWKSRLSELLDNSGKPVLDSAVGPGTTICIAANPDFHGIFHLLAFWAIGCTVQYISLTDLTEATNQLNESGCKVMLCSGVDSGWMEARKKQFNGVMVQLPQEERADQLTKSEKQGKASTLTWPVPQRPTPVVIVQTSGTTGHPKLIRLSLYFFTIRLSQTRQNYLRRAHLTHTSKTPHSHPRLVPFPFYWTTTFYSIFTNLTTATPIAFAYFSDIYRFPPSQLLDWAVALDVGAMTCPAGSTRLIPKAIYEAHAEFLRSLFSFSITGSAMSDALSRVFEELKIPITNVYGASELGRVLYASKPPYTHLRPSRGASPPLVHPVSDYDTTGSRYVELWLTPAMWPSLAHYLATGGFPIKLEPFPGDGPHKGELALNLGDIFQEVTVSNTPDSTTDTVYIHVGRHTDEIFLGEGGFGRINGALYEAAIEYEINTRIGQSGTCPWTLNGVQLFGNNMPCTALVLQLCPNQNLIGTCGADPLKNLPIRELYESVERTNDSLGLTGRKRVHTAKRTLIISSDGTFMHGEGGERLSGTCTLSLTHKRTPKRWEDVCRFKSWLDGLDLSEA
ncbi:unnamed protein product [Rhizoctonia solani]|uniref:AMP-dependent synthetase/ligase domain-containing protein n=1 Tax=Rhizoctonia solani TaxID=456999 RepID=A0A8H3BTE8_9AGAM|nr:unnamed protein product [Rhizoctonia solani]